MPSKRKRKTPITEGASLPSKKARKPHTFSKDILKRKKNPLIMKYDQDLTKAKVRGTPPGRTYTETPPGRSDTETPPGRTNTETPPGRTYTETPPERSDTETPPGRTNTETPPGRSDTETPPGRTNTETPPGRIDTETPPGRTYTETPPGRIDTETRPGRTDTETRPGRTNTETPPGRIDTETPQGRTYTETPPGRTNTETPPGRSDTETPPGRTNTETPPGRSDTETPPGRNDTETPPGRSDTETPPGRSDTETRRGRTNTKTRRGRTNTETRPGRSDTETPPGRTYKETRRGRTNTETPPGRTDTETRPGRTNTETRPGRTNTETPPGRSDTETPPGRTYKETRRGRTNTETPPGRTYTETPPGRTNTETPPGRSDTETPPGRTNTETPPGRSDTETPPGRSDTETPPGRSDTETRRGRTNTKTRRGRTNTETRPGRSDTETPPGRTYKETRRGRTNTETPPGRTDTETRPGRTNTETRPGRTNTETPPGRTNTETPPGRTDTETLPGRTNTETRPGRTNTETPPGGIYTETPPGRTYTETPPGRTYTETRPGRSDTETPPGRSYTETPPGRTNTETPPGRTNTETPPGRTNTETRPGRTNTETRPGRTITEPRPGRTNTEKETRPGRSDTETRPGRTNTETPPGRTYTETRPGRTYTETRPGKTYTETRPGRTNTETHPGRTITEPRPGRTNTEKETRPGRSDTETRPGRTYTETRPGRTNTETPPGRTNTETRPGRTNTEKETRPGRSDTETRPGRTYTETRPGRTNTETPPGRTNTETRPGRTNTETRPGRSDTGTDEGSTDTESSQGRSNTPDVYSGTDETDYVPNSDSDDDMSDVYIVDIESFAKSSLKAGKESKPAEQKVKEDEKICDSTHPGIFVRKYVKESNQSSKLGRPYDRRHACLFCHKLMTNIQTHLQIKHRNEEEVKSIIDLKRKIDEDDNAKLRVLLHNKQTLLRNKGNHFHNTLVNQNQSGEIILSRRRDFSKFDLSLYGPCPFCSEWIILEHASKHQTSCPGRVSDEDCTKGSIILQSKIMKGQINKYASKQLIKEVFTCMRRDRLTEVAQSDDLIISLGDVWLMKNIGNKLRRKNFTSFRMRLAAKLLILCIEETGENEASMTKFISPSYFDILVKCALKACKETQDEELLNPSTAIKMGYDLSRLASLKLGFSIKAGDEEEKKEASDFLRLMSMEWGVRVNKLARVTLEERHFNKPKNLPIPKDIESLSKFLVQELKQMDISEPNEELFRRVTLYTEARLLLYNRRRPGELESLSVDAYRKRCTLDEADLAMRQSLTELEKQLLDSQDLVEIRGKTGRGVPLLIPNEVKRMLDFLSDAECREKGGIKPGNGFMFGNTGDGVIRAGDALNEVKQHPKLKLDQPNRILATNLRKYTATIAQVLNLSDQEMKWVCNHLGHTMKVHDHYYRQTSGSIERIDIAKLLLLQENNIVGKYSNRKLSEVQMDDIIRDIETTEASEETLRKSEDIGCHNLGEEHSDGLLEEPRPKARIIRVKWSEGEEKELRKYFSDYFMERIRKKCPSQDHCKNAILESKQNGGTIHLRSWETIKKKVSNMLVKAGQN